MEHEIKVRSNEPFKVSPNLDQPPYQKRGDDVLQDEVPFLLEDLGIRGSVRFREVQPVITADYPIIFPAGPTLPLAIEIYLKNLTMNGLEQVRCTLTYNEKNYEGDPNHDIGELLQKEDADQRFWFWIDPDTHKVSQPIFPREVIGDIEYTITF